MSKLARGVSIVGVGYTPFGFITKTPEIKDFTERELITMAYEKTCVNTGGMNWPYMNKIIASWHKSGFRTAADVRNGDRKIAVPKGASGELGQAELEAIQRVLREG